MQVAVGSPILAKAKVGTVFQMERVGYFCVDTTSKANHMVLNRTVTLRESVATKAVKSK